MRGDNVIIAFDSPVASVIANEAVLGFRGVKWCHTPKVNRQTMLLGYRPQSKRRMSHRVGLRQKVRSNYENRKSRDCN